MGRIGAVTGPWREILEASENREIYLLPEWYLAYWKTFPENNGIRFLLFNDDNTLVGIAPLCLVRRGPFRHLRFLGQPHFIHRSDFIMAPGWEAACLAAFAEWLRERRDWDILAFRNFGLFSGNARELAETCRGQGLQARIGPGSVNYYLTTDAYSDFDDYWKSAFNAKRRKKIRNLRNRLERYPEMRWAVSDRLAKGVLEKMVEIELRKRDGDAIGRSFFAFPGKSRFFRKLSTSLTDTGALQSICLYVEERLVSYLIGFPYRGKFFAYQTAYDPDFSVVSPGTHILLKTIRTAMASGMDEVDMLVGDQEYKQVFTDRFRRGEHLFVFNRGGRGTLLRGWQDRIKPAAKKIKERFTAIREALAGYQKRRITRGNE
jgi:CelD/BcsL family acetyltransferase involved in cellulose biosynthesis